VYLKEVKYVETEPLYLRSLAIRKQAMGLDHPDVTESLENYAELFRKTNRKEKAAKLEARAQAIRAGQVSRTAPK
jgi:hypothetical protein